MITFRAVAAALLAAGLLLAACSTEQQDWRSAEAADTTEAYARFMQQHPRSELARQARLRMDQLAQERDWQRTQSDGTLEAYREFVARYPSGSHSQEARIRIESAALGSIPRIGPQSPGAQAAPPTGVKLLQLASAARPQPPAPSPAPVDAPPPGTEMARPAYTPAAAYAVQLGAFGTQASADREWQRLQSRFAAQLAGFTPRVVAADTSAGELYRLQVAAAGEAQARALCNSLKEQSQSCVPVVPR